MHSHVRCTRIRYCAGAITVKTSWNIQMIYTINHNGMTNWQLVTFMSVPNNRMEVIFSVGAMVKMAI